MKDNLEDLSIKSSIFKRFSDEKKGKSGELKLP
jgi:hypothetical protein